jgi:uncharacterized membrane protein YgdD (TMEM256/DUF423 family)
VEWTIWIALGGISGGLAVASGAFGAHALRERLSPESLAIFETGARYQMYHAMALLAVGLLAVKIDSLALKTAGIAFAAGTLLFSGSLYTLALTGARQWGMVTPVGGLAFLVGWGALVFAALSR